MSPTSMTLLGKRNQDESETVKDQSHMRRALPDTDPFQSAIRHAVGGGRGMVTNDAGDDGLEALREVIARVRLTIEENGARLSELRARLGEAEGEAKLADLRERVRRGEEKQKKHEARLQDVLKRIQDRE